MPGPNVILFCFVILLKCTKFQRKGTEAYPFLIQHYSSNSKAKKSSNIEVIPPVSSLLNRLYLALVNATTFLLPFITSSLCSHLELGDHLSSYKH